MAARKTSSRGLTAADKNATTVHLADSVEYNLKHAKVHVQMAKKSPNKTSLKHNLQHAEKHAKEAQTHATKLNRQLAKTPATRRAVRELKTK